MNWKVWVSVASAFIIMAVATAYTWAVFAPVPTTSRCVGHGVRAYTQRRMFDSTMALWADPRCR